MTPPLLQTQQAQYLNTPLNVILAPHNVILMSNVHINGPTSQITADW